MGNTSIVKMSFMELRQRGAALARSLREEANVRVREGPAESVKTELAMCEQLLEEKACRAKIEEKEREDIAAARLNQAALNSATWKAIDTTCFHTVQSNLQRHPMNEHDVGLRPRGCGL